MLQNNLGNALQSVESTHAFENRRRALAAYDEALKVRTRGDMPLEYANTIANRAACLWGLPDDEAAPAAGNLHNLRQARHLLSEALEIFGQHGELDKVAAVSESLADIAAELAAAETSPPLPPAVPDTAG